MNDPIAERRGMMRRIVLYLSCVGLLLGCALGPQPYLQAPQRADVNQPQDEGQCLAQASLEAMGAGDWSSDRALRQAFYQQAKAEAYVRCMNARGYTLVYP